MSLFKAGLILFIMGIGAFAQAEVLEYKVFAPQIYDANARVNNCSYEAEQIIEDGVVNVFLHRQDGAWIDSSPNFAIAIDSNNKRAKILIRNSFGSGPKSCRGNIEFLIRVSR